MNEIAVSFRLDPRLPTFLSALVAIMMLLLTPIAVVVLLLGTAFRVPGFRLVPDGENGYILRLRPARKKTPPATTE